MQWNCVDQENWHEIMAGTYTINCNAKRNNHEAIIYPDKLHGIFTCLPAKDKQCLLGVVCVMSYKQLHTLTNLSPDNQRSVF